MVVNCARAVARRHTHGITQYATTAAISALRTRGFRALTPSTSTYHARSSRHPRNTFSTSIAIKQQNITPSTPTPTSSPSTIPRTEEPAGKPSLEEEDQKKQHHQRRTRRRILFAGAFLFLGSTLGSIVRAALAPPELPPPGSEKDIYLLSALREKASHLDLHKQLSEDPAWESWDAYEGVLKTSQSPTLDPSKKGEATSLPTLQDDETKPHHHRRITSDILTSSRAIAYQRIFHNPSTHEVVSIVYFGGSVAGWPGVVHGGLLATLLDESLGRCAILLFPARTGVTANLELDYKKPTRTEGWYVIRTNPVPLKEEDDVLPTGSAKRNGETNGWWSWLWGSKSSSSNNKEGETVKLTGRKSDRKRWITGTLEKLDGTVCVRAKALFVVPKGAKVGPISPRF